MSEQETLKQALRYRNENKLKESNELLVALAKESPADAYINYQCAWSFDCLGEEAQAVPYYEVAIQGKLHKEDLQGAYLGLGSTYRTLGEYEKSRDVFEKAVSFFPENESLKVFYAMTLYNLQAHSEAMELLLKCLTNTTSDHSILMYKRAIEFYSDKLDETWK
ncbi:tetratricopeptide repeat protein [Solibacillus daqui]|uniref:tetratricopeptide repeat protein n=1 Tax=Solibacillus daqui TaxID=2912187 RepID=UPI0023654F2E|nr:tetratricopeptide repeat protein [Solibacillus daqui]